MCKKKIKISDIAKFLNTEFLGVDHTINKITSLDKIEDNIVVFSKNKMLNIDLNYKSLIICPLNYQYETSAVYSVIKVQNPRLVFAKITEHFFINKPLPSINKTTIIGINCKIHKNVSIGSNCFIGDNVEIGENSVINNNVVISNNTKIGTNCYIKSGVVIGEDGFGFDFEDDGTPFRIPHIGNVKIGNSVEIGANTVIARATLESTIIGDDVKIDDQVFIAHNCRIGDKTLIIAGAEVSGSVNIGKRCWIGPNCSIIQKVTIGDNVTIGIGAVITKNIESNKKVMGFNALDLKSLVKLKKRIEFGK